MSGNRTPAEIADAPIPAPTCGIPTPICRAAQSQWRQERLIEARGILADITQHPDTLVILACRVVCTTSSESRERGDALSMARFLTRHPSGRTNASSKGGAT